MKILCMSLLALALALDGVVISASGRVLARQGEPYTLSVDVDLVLLNVRVLYGNGEVVSGLQQDKLRPAVFGPGEHAVAQRSTA